MQTRRKTITGCVIAAVVAIILLLAIRWIYGKPAPTSTALSKPPQILARKLDHPMQPSRVTTPPASQAGTAAAKPQPHVCGMDGLPRTVTDANEVGQYVFDTSRETYDRWKTELIGGSDVRARAVGLSLQRLDDISARSLAADTSLEQLVELATTAREPVVYGIAVGVCKTGLADDAVPACRRLSVSEWAKIDPDNAVPWLANAAAARDNGDGWAESVAFARAAQTHKVDNYSDAGLSAALAALPADAARAERTAVEAHLIGYDAALARPDIIEVSRYCSATALQQSQIHDQCDAVAQLLLDHGGTLLNFSLGRSIGQRLGWAAVRLDDLARERDALLNLLAPNGDEEWSCNYMAREDEFVQRRAQVGELAALRELRGKRVQPGQPSQ